MWTGTIERLSLNLMWLSPTHNHFDSPWKTQLMQSKTKLQTVRTQLMQMLLKQSSTITAGLA